MDARAPVEDVRAEARVLERVALSPCISKALDAIRSSVEQNAGRSTVLEAVDRFATPRHTWDSIAFQAAVSAGVLAQMPVDRVDAMSRFYSLMPALEKPLRCVHADETGRAGDQELQDQALAEELVGPDFT